MKKNNPAERYLKTLESDQSRDTVMYFLNNVARFIEPDSSLKEIDWSVLDVDVVLEFRDSLKKHKRAPSTVNGYLSAIKGVAEHAWHMKLIDVETFQQIKSIKNFKGKRETSGRSLTLEELNQMLDHCIAQPGAINMRDAALIATMYGAGLRRHEAAKLTLKDFDKKIGALTVIGKGNKERTNPLNSRIIELLQCWLDERGQDDSGALFCRVYKNGRVDPCLGISSRAVYDIIVKRYTSAGLNKLTPHDLRRTFATALIASGEDLFTVQDLMGHASLETTKRYDKRGDDEKVRAGRALPL